MIILFVGGGTLGPVTPLLATARALRRIRPGVTLHWIGTPNGPERALVEAEGIAFDALPVVKWPRYFSVQWLTFPFRWLRVRSEARRLVEKIEPDVVVTVGGFTAVPVVFAAAKLGIPSVTHQLDVEPGMTNRKIAKKCASVTTSFEYARPPFGERVSDERIATPTRLDGTALPSRTEAARVFGLDPKRPVVFLLGGGTGSKMLNEHVARTLKSWLAFTQLIHSTGIGKGVDDAPFAPEGYVERTLIKEEWPEAIALADLVVCRSGLGTLSEIAALEKAAITVPIPKSQQEANARAFEERGAIVVVQQTSKTFDDDLLTAAKLLLQDEEERQAMGERAHAFLPTDDGSALAARVLKAVRLPTDAVS